MSPVMELDQSVTAALVSQNALQVIQHTSCELAGASSPGVLLACKNATQRLGATGLKLSTFSKAGMGVLKLATTQLKHQEKKARVVRASSMGKPHLSSDNSQCKKSPLDQLTALVMHGHARLQQLGKDQYGTKPQNCRRIVVLGAPRVGKTSILRRFLREDFEERYEPTCEDFHRKLYHIRGETYQIDILDASGERSFPAKRRLSILTGDIFLLVFSLDDRSSFEEVRALHEEILSAKMALHRTKHKLCVPTVICANKVDLPSEQHAVLRTEVLRAFGNGCALFETSAKDSVNLEQVFEGLARRGGLPLETGPSQHHKVSIKSYQALRAARQADKGCKGAVCDAPCGALYPLARRPSFGTDLRLVLGPDGNRKQSKALDKCQIQ
ncbi:GTP-binding protein Rhes [Triplophysa rosa]|uniref:GTP-binding protein Rhes n=1 Tax=Triplophysa rosa TaxID=992332 RepID=A0A9W8C8H9_TRIRA|nr:GTP-binding protein Rhes [Triplophysa rosa]KAI7810403.1 putative GTP-binding protein Rhes [Triplophysa rosa]